MVATRRSLGGQASPSPPPTASSSDLTRAQRAALKKLNIAGTDALKGDPKAAQAARDSAQVYHYRGAAYATDANTNPAWILNQPQRYRRRESASAVSGGDGQGSTAVDEEEEEEQETRRPAKRRSMPHQNRLHRSVASTETPSPGKGRAARGGRQSLPAKRKSADLDEDQHRNTDLHGYTVSGAQDTRPPRIPNWLPETATARKDRLNQRKNAASASNSPIPNSQTVDRDIQRRRQEAIGKNYKVQPLGRHEIMSEKDITRAKVVKLARQQKLLLEKMIEWEMAKELLDKTKRQAGLKSAFPTNIDNTPKQTTHDSPIDLTGDDDEIGEQWQREQDQIRATTNPPANSDSEEDHEDASSFPDAHMLHLLSLNRTYHPFTKSKSGLPRPHGPVAPLPPPANKALLTGANALPHTSRHGYAPSSPPPPPARRHETDADFSRLRPDGPLPNKSAGGDEMRWTITARVKRDDVTGEQRAEYEIDRARLEGETRQQQKRRVKREFALAEKWRRDEMERREARDRADEMERREARDRAWVSGEEV